MTDLIWGSIIGFIVGVVIARLTYPPRPSFIIHPKKLTPSHVTLKKILPEGTSVWFKDHFEYRPAIIVGYVKEREHLNSWNGDYYNVKYIRCLGSKSRLVGAAWVPSTAPDNGNEWVPSSYVFEPSEMVKTRFESYLNYFDRVALQPKSASHPKKVEDEQLGS